MPPRAMEINLGIRGVTRTARGFLETAKAADTAADAYDRFTGAAERLARTIETLSRQRVGFSGPGTLAPAGSGAGGSGSVRSASGPVERLDRARQAFQQEPESFDNRYRLFRAEQSLQRAERAMEPKTFLDKLGDAVGTSRFNLGGGNGPQMMPLVNRVLPLFGQRLASLLNPLTLAAAAFHGFASVARPAAERLGELSRARTLSGGTGRDVAGLTALGISPGDIASRAAQFRERISLQGGDVFAMQAARQIGLNPLMGRNYGPQNEANLYLRGLEGLRELRSDPTRQLRLARQLGLEEDLDRVNVSDPLWNEMRRNIAARGRMIDQGAQPARDLEASRNLMRGAWENATGGLGRQWQGLETWWNQGLARDLNTIGNGGFRVPFTDITLGNQPQPPAADTQKEATKELTSKIEQLTDVLEQGLAGGGERAQNALRLRGPALAEAIRAAAFRHGAWQP